ncbi:lipoprotein HlpB [Glaesserella sp.]|uniref:lipoprotein HlpB n=1 Tax=Glaesserella sp. TaxID=2094731 RepID=UPI0035A18152
MNKMTKISAAALFAIFLTACDKPADKPATEAPKAETPAAQQPAPAAEAPKTEAAPVAADQQGIEDFKKIVEWNQAQEQTLAGFQAELQQKLASQDKAQIEEALKTFTSKVDEVLKSLDSLDIKNADVNVFKAKTKETLTLSNELIAESVKAMANPTATDVQKVIQDKTQQLMQSGAELQKLQAELQQKFGGQ